MKQFEVLWKDLIKKGRRRKEHIDLAHWMEIWLEHYCRPRVKSSTYSVYFRTASNHIIPGLGNLLLGEITTGHLQEFFNLKRYSGRMDGSGCLSPKTVRTIFTVLDGAMNQALLLEKIDRNPCHGVILASLTKSNAKSISRAEQEALERILAQISLKEGPGAEIGIWFALYLGLRIGEICALTWADVDLRKRMLQVRRTRQRVLMIQENQKGKTEIVDGVPKTEVGCRNIPLPDFIYNKLKELKRIVPSQRLKPSCCIVQKKDGQGFEPRTYRRYWARVCRMADLEGYCFHSLRHTFATRAIEQNFDMKTLSVILGHADIGTTMKLYVHSHDEQKRVQMRKMESLYVKGKKKLDAQEKNESESI